MTLTESDLLSLTHPTEPSWNPPGGEGCPPCGAQRPRAECWAFSSQLSACLFRVPDSLLRAVCGALLSYRLQSKLSCEEGKSAAPAP